MKRAQKAAQASVRRVGGGATFEIHEWRTVMNLSVSERLALLGVLPKEGNILKVRILSDLRKEIGFTETEQAELKIRQQPGGGVSWDPEKASEKDIEFGARSLQIVADALRSLDKRKALSEAHLPLWDRFIGDGDGDGDGKEAPN